MLTKRDIGLNIQNTRKKRGLLQKDLAAKLKTRKEQISRIETGKGNYGIDWLFEIARVLECQVEDFCNGHRHPQTLHETFRLIADILEKSESEKSN